MDSDVVFLSSQDELLEQNRGYGKNYSDPNYYMPSKCDTMVTAFRKWLGSKGGGGPEWLGIPAKRSDGYLTGWIRPQLVAQRGGRDKLLDRYRQHTDSCVACRNAHRNMHALRELWKRSFGIAGGLLLLAPNILLRPLIARLECVPWPRKRWRRPTKAG
jgi:hypothetical protein